MSLMDEIRSYRDLRVWRDAMTLTEEGYRFSKELPRDELFGLTSQVRRSAVSIPANIPEGYGRDSKGLYVCFMKIAQGSLKELETHLISTLEARKLRNGRPTAVAMRSDWSNVARADPQFAERFGGLR
jgi:four helix bundle protein